MVKIEEIADIANRYGYIIPTKIIEEYQDREFDISEEELLNFFTEQTSIMIEEETFIKFLESKIVEKKEESFHYDIEILHGYEYTSKASSLTDFREYLRSRYERLSRRIKSRLGIPNIPTIATINSQVIPGEKPWQIYVVGIIYSKKIHESYITIELEDPTSYLKATAIKSRKPHVYNQLLRIPLDSVIGIKATMTKDRRVYIDEVYLPSIKPGDRRPPLDRDIYVALISDIHVGSRKFNEELFNQFIDLLRGEVDNYDLKEIIRNTYYLSIAGDIVDGVGVYPGQEKDLEIENLWDQYDTAYRMLKRLPSKIRVIMIPGNHDASRNSLPQPPIFKKFASKFYDDKRFYMLGNPANIRLHGENIVIYHGDYVQDILSSTPGLDMDDISGASRILVDTGHLASNITLNTKVFPDKVDRLVLPKETRIIHYGHTHKFNISKANDVLIFNTGTFQEQTNYQKMLKIEPDLGKIPFLNLRTLKVTVIDLRS